MFQWNALSGKILAEFAWVELIFHLPDTKVTAEIARVVKHEIAHHFGISDARLKELDK